MYKHNITILKHHNGIFPLSLTPIPKVCATSQKGPEILKVFALLGKLGLVKTNESNFKEEKKNEFSISKNRPEINSWYCCYAMGRRNTGKKD